MNTTPYNEKGSLKKHFFRGAAGSLRTIRKQLATWQARYATLMKLESHTTGVIGEIDIMLKCVEQMETDQDADAKLQRARDKNLLAAGFPKKRGAYERQRGDYLARRKGG